MRALVRAKSEPGIWLEERPIPEIGPEDVLVKVHRTGICGTDIHIHNWDDWAKKTVPVPLVTGLDIPARSPPSAPRSRTSGSASGSPARAMLSA